MLIRSGELQRKEILNLEDGARIGYADHLVIELDTATVQALVVCGRRRLFGLLGREPDLAIPWSDVELIGEDIIFTRIRDLPARFYGRSSISRLQRYWRE